jgi:TonB-linked SusC/RagA family outer membrane protein
MSKKLNANCCLNKTFYRLAACTLLVAGCNLGQLMASPDTGYKADLEQPVQDGKTIKGKIVNDKGDEIIGASIKEKGTTNGTISKTDGSFSFSSKSSEPTLLITYVGYKPQQVVVKGSSVVNVVLQEDSKMVDEVVVIGYGTQRKGDVTSAVTSIKAKDFTTGKIGDAAELIKGKVAGLSITKGSGDPNAESSIRLRGVISLKGSATPLVLVDGIEGSLGTVAPENIASIDVLKDASSAAIYGTRGANGVIFITTKSGKRDSNTQASYSSYISTSKFGKTLDFMSASEIREGLTSYNDKGYDTNWLDAITRNAFTHNHNFNVRGGTAKTTYSADFTYRNEEGVIVDTYNNEMKMNFDVSHWMLNDKLKVNFNMVKGWHKNSATNANNDGESNIYRQAILRNPTEPIYNEDGSYYENFQILNYYNPVGMIKERKGEYKSENTRLTGNIMLEPLKGWQTNLMLTRKTYTNHDKGYYTSKFYSQVMDNHTGYAYQSMGEGYTDNLEATSKYNNAFGKHRIDALVGYSYQYDEDEGFYANNYDFPQNDFFLYNNLSAGAALKNGKAGIGSNKSDSRLIGYFGRMSYGYADRYNALLSIRREGSSKFGHNRKWGSFPSVSLGWTLSNEEFMKDISWLNNLKLRGGYGVTGVIPNERYLSLTKYLSGDRYYYDNGKWKPGLEVRTNPNVALQWETSREYNIGADLSVLKDRLGLTLELYSKTTSDMLFDYTVPVPPNLVSSMIANVGKMRNKGIEIAINATPVTSKDFEWKTILTASHNVNKLLSLSNELYQSKNELPWGGVGEPISMSTHRLEVGKPVSNFYGFKSVGVNQAGHWLIEDPTNGKAVELTDNMLNNSSYKQYLGNGLPKYILGWANTIRYKDFDLSMQMTSQLGFKILNEPRAFYENNSIAYNRLRSVKDAPYGGQYTLSSSQKQTLVSYYIENGDFLKLTNLTLGYNLPLKTNKYVRTVRAYLSADNLYCLTSYSGLDPELSNSDGTTAGLDKRDKYPITKSFTFGVNVTF